MDVKLEKWFRPNIDKEVLKELTKKSDTKGLIHVSIYFGLLSIVGYLAYITWGLGCQSFGFMYMEIYFVFVILFGMRLVIRQRSKRNF